jgi:hypothetical protein
LSIEKKHEKKQIKWEVGQDRRGKMSFVVKKGKEVVLKCGHEDFPDKKDIGKPHAMIVTEGTVEKLK